MVSRTFMHPPGPHITDNVVLAILGLVGIRLLPELAKTWTPIELLIAYDWAIREHLRASDNMIRRRAKPSFIPPVDHPLEHVHPVHCGDKVFMCHLGQWCNCNCDSCDAAKAKGDSGYADV